MQERYLGDSHDYAKYALLRHLHGALSGPIGVNWYLTEPRTVDTKANNDGEKRHHLGPRKPWHGWESDLLAQMERFSLLSERRLRLVSEIGILPADTIFFEKLVPQEGRGVWHREAMKHLEAASLVFLDPDNGFEVNSMSRRSAAKYATYSEAIDYFHGGKTVISIQFARQCDPINKALTVRKRLMELAGSDHVPPVIRARMAPNLLFIALCPQGRGAELDTAIKKFAGGRDKIELIQ